MLGRALIIALVALGVVASAGSGQSPQPRLETERFERDPAWEGVRNRIAAPPSRKAHSFGYQPGAEGQRYGRIGGTVWRSLKSAYYGMRLSTLSLDDRLTASGTLALTGAKTTVGYQNGSTIFVGFFNSKERGWRPVNFVGFRLEGYNEPDGATLEIAYGTRAWTAGGSFVNTAGGAQERNVRELDSGQLRRVAPDGVKHRWSLEHDPATSIISFTFDGKVSTQALRPEHLKQGAEMNRFGLFNAELPGNEMTAFLDDLTVNGQRVDLNRDPKWEGRNNRATYVENTGYGINEFGYSATTGSVGGRFWRVQEPEYVGHCGDNIGRLTMNDPLFAAGRISIPRFSIDSGMHFGWYNSREQGWPPKNFVGVYLDSLSSVGRFITPMYGTSRARRERIEGRYRLFGAAHGSEEVLFYPDGRWYEWALKYDPAASGGNGASTLWLGDQKQTVPLAAGVRKERAVMDRFGVFNMQDNNGKDCVVYLDDLRYTTSKPR